MTKFQHILSFVPNFDNRKITLHTLDDILQKLLSEDSSKESLLTSRLPLKIRNTQSGPSRVDNAGRGLFATRDCQKGEVLTCYPGDVLLRSASHENTDIFWGAHVEDRLQMDDRSLENTMAAYALQVSELYAIIGLPFMDQDTAYLGHFANDGARPPQCESQISTYVLESNDMANAMHQSLEDCHVVTVATRDIVKSEEILVTYGPEYWMEHSTSLAWNGRNGETKMSTDNETGKGFG